MRVCIGGSFDRFHKGHKYLVKKALDLAGNDGYLFVGLTTRKIDGRKDVLESYEKRKKNLERFVEEKKTNTKVEIKPINDKFGPAIKDDFDSIVVSPETKKTACKINKLREKNKMKPLKIFVIPFVLSEDGKPVSSTRIRNKEINNKGKLIK